MVENKDKKKKGRQIVLLFSFYCGKIERFFQQTSMKKLFNAAFRNQDNTSGRFIFQRHISKMEKLSEGYIDDKLDDLAKRQKKQLEKWGIDIDTKVYANPSVKNGPEYQRQPDQSHDESLVFADEMNKEELKKRLKDAPETFPFNSENVLDIYNLLDQNSKHYINMNRSGLERLNFGDDDLKEFIKYELRNFRGQIEELVGIGNLNIGNTQEVMRLINLGAKTPLTLQETESFINLMNTGTASGTSLQLVDLQTRGGTDNVIGSTPVSSRAEQGEAHKGATFDVQVLQTVVKKIQRTSYNTPTSQEDGKYGRMTFLRNRPLGLEHTKNFNIDAGVRVIYVETDTNGNPVSFASQSDFMVAPIPQNERPKDYQDAQIYLKQGGIAQGQPFSPGKPLLQSQFNHYFKNVSGPYTIEGTHTKKAPNNAYTYTYKWTGEVIFQIETNENLKQHTEIVNTEYGQIINPTVIPWNSGGLDTPNKPITRLSDNRTIPSPSGLDLNDPSTSFGKAEFNNGERVSFEWKNEVEQGNQTRHVPNRLHIEFLNQLVNLTQTYNESTPEPFIVDDQKNFVSTDGRNNTHNNGFQWYPDNLTQSNEGRPIQAVKLGNETTTVTLSHNGHTARINKKIGDKVTLKEVTDAFNGKFVSGQITISANGEFKDPKNYEKVTINYKRTIEVLGQNEKGIRHTEILKIQDGQVLDPKPTIIEITTNDANSEVVPAKEVLEDMIIKNEDTNQELGRISKSDITPYLTGNQQFNVGMFLDAIYKKNPDFKFEPSHNIIATTKGRFLDKTKNPAVETNVSYVLDIDLEYKAQKKHVEVRNNITIDLKAGTIIKDQPISIPWDKDGSNSIHPTGAVQLEIFEATDPSTPKGSISKTVGQDITLHELENIVGKGIDENAQFIVRLAPNPTQNNARVVMWDKSEKGTVTEKYTGEIETVINVKETMADRKKVTRNETITTDKWGRILLNETKGEIEWYWNEPEGEKKYVPNMKWDEAKKEYVPGSPLVKLEILKNGKGTGIYLEFQPGSSGQYGFLSFQELLKATEGLNINPKTDYFELKGLAYLQEPGGKLRPVEFMPHINFEVNCDEGGECEINKCRVVDQETAIEEATQIAEKKERHTRRQLTAHAIFNYFLTWGGLASRRHGWLSVLSEGMDKLGIDPLDMTDYDEDSIIPKEYLKHYEDFLKLTPADEEEIVKNLARIGVQDKIKQLEDLDKLFADEQRLTDDDITTLRESPLLENVNDERFRTFWTKLKDTTWETIKQSFYASITASALTLVGAAPPALVGVVFIELFRSTFLADSKLEVMSNDRLDIVAEHARLYKELGIPIAYAEQVGGEIATEGYEAHRYYSVFVALDKKIKGLELTAEDQNLVDEFLNKAPSNVEYAKMTYQSVFDYNERIELDRTLPVASKYSRAISRLKQAHLLELEEAIEKGMIDPIDGKIGHGILGVERLWEWTFGDSTDTPEEAYEAIDKEIKEREEELEELVAELENEAKNVDDKKSIKRDYDSKKEELLALYALRGKAFNQCKLGPQSELLVTYSQIEEILSFMGQNAKYSSAAAALEPYIQQIIAIDKTYQNNIAHRRAGFYTGKLDGTSWMLGHDDRMSEAFAQIREYISEVHDIINNDELKEIYGEIRRLEDAKDRFESLKAQAEVAGDASTAKQHEAEINRIQVQLEGAKKKEAETKAKIFNENTTASRLESRISGGDIEYFRDLNKALEQITSRDDLAQIPEWLEPGKDWGDGANLSICDLAKADYHVVENWDQDTGMPIGFAFEVGRTGPNQEMKDIIQEEKDFELNITEGNEVGANDLAQALEENIRDLPESVKQILENFNPNQETFLEVLQGLSKDQLKQIYDAAIKAGIPTAPVFNEIINRVVVGTEPVGGILWNWALKPSIEGTIGAIGLTMLEERLLRTTNIIVQGGEEHDYRPAVKVALEKYRIKLIKESLSEDNKNMAKKMSYNQLHRHWKGIK